MRFTVATIALLAQALPSWTLQDAQITTASSSLVSLSLSNSQGGAGGTDNSQIIQKILASKKGNALKERRNKRKSSSQSRLEKLKAASASSSTECNPDVGVLACGVGKYCQRDDASSLGGLCAPVSDQGRKLEQDYEYTPHFGLYYCVVYADDYDCDCESWDPTTNSGSLSCVFTSDDYCICDDVCYDVVAHYESDGESWTYSYCMEFKTPYEHTYCFAYTNPGETCSISLDGVQCTSCSMSSGDDSCSYDFDCENVGMGKASGCYDYPLIPILQSCYTYYDPCTLCPDGVKNPTGLVTFPGYGDFYCENLEATAVAGLFNEEYCTTLSEFVEETCCEELFQCNICGEEDMYISMPNNTINFGDISATCEEIVLAGQTGAIDETLCTAMPNAVAEPCGCMSSSTESPTVTTTSAPTVGMVATGSPTTMSETAPTAAPTATSSVSKTTLSVITIGLNILALAFVLQ